MFMIAVNTDRVFVCLQVKLMVHSPEASSIPVEVLTLDETTIHCAEVCIYPENVDRSKRKTLSLHIVNYT